MTATANYLSRLLLDMHATAEWTVLTTGPTPTADDLIIAALRRWSTGRYLFPAHYHYRSHNALLIMRRL